MKSRYLISLIWLWFGVALFWGVENTYINLYFINPAIIPAAEQKAVYISMMVAASSIANVIALWLSGAASDACRSRLGRRKPYIIGGGILGGACMMMFPLVKLFPTTLEKVGFALVIDCALSFFADFTSGSRQALMTDLTYPEERGRINGVLNVPNFLGMALPIVLAEMVRQQLGLDSFFYIGGGLMIIACTTSVLFVKEVPPPAEQLTFRQYIRKFFTVVNYHNNKAFYQALLGTALLSLGGNIFYPFLLPYVMNYLGFRDMSYTLIAGIIILMNMIIQVPMGIAADHFGRKPVYKVVLPISAVLLFAFAFVPPGNVWGTLLFGGGGFTLYFTLKLVVTSWMQDLCPPDQRGSLLIYNNLADILPMTPGAFIGGWLADSFTEGGNALFHPVMFIAAAIVICFSLPVFLRTPETIQRKK